MVVSELVKVKLKYGNGCKAYPDCFSCPFGDCGLAPTKFDIRNAGIRELWRLGHSLPQIAEQFSLSLRQVQRIYR